MRLYPTPAAGDVTSVDDGEFGHFDPVADGGFDFPDPLSARLHGFCLRGQAQWEDAVERQNRLLAAEAERRRSPEALLEAVEAITKAAARSTQPAPAAAAKGQRARRPAASK